MAVPGENSRDFPVRLTKIGGAAVDEEADRLGVEKVEVFRIALAEYFARRGQRIDFSPEKGGKRKRMTEQQAIQRVRERIQALGLPEPEVEYKQRHKTYDLAWPEQRVAVEISQRKRPADGNDWTVGFVKPSMTDDQIDKVLKALPL